jgi:hypothetical protein
MPFTKFSNLDFDQIKTSIKDYLRSNSNFSDFDFEGSNFSVLIDTLAYNTYITAFNTNMAVNESFLDSATVRRNVVSLASNIGYLPRSRKASKATISFSVTPNNDSDSDLINVVLQPGIVCTGSTSNTSYIFSTIEPITGIINGSTVSFNSIDIYQGTFLTKTFTFDASINQRFVLENSFIDTETIKVYIKRSGDDGDGTEYKQIDNIIDIDKNSRVYFVREIDDQKYELRFGDGIFGKKLGTESGDDGNIITVKYLITDGEDGNDVSQFSFAGTIKDESNTLTFPSPTLTIDSIKSQNGADIEPLDSIRYFAPLSYSSQNRAVTAKDYESIIKRIYPDTESLSVVGGEEMDPPQYGNVLISIKPRGANYISDFNKNQILSKLRQYSVSGINQKIVDLKLLFIELESSVYYTDSFVSNVEELKTKIINTLTQHSKSVNLNKFGGRFKYSKTQQIIDSVDRNAITSNITKVIIRRNLNATLNQNAQYELCYGNQFHVKPDGYNIKSTGFNILGESSKVYLTDRPNAGYKTGVLSIVKQDADNSEVVDVKRNAGTIDYIKGEIELETIYITSTDKPDNVIEVEAVPESNDVVGLRDLYLNLNVPKSRINMIRDVISSGVEVSGVEFIKSSYTSSYYNGKLVRQ